MLHHLAFHCRPLWYLLRPFKWIFTAVCVGVFFGFLTALISGDPGYVRMAIIFGFTVQVLNLILPSLSSLRPVRQVQRLQRASAPPVRTVFYEPPPPANVEPEIQAPEAPPFYEQEVVDALAGMGFTKARAKMAVRAARAAGAATESDVVREALRSLHAIK